MKNTAVVSSPKDFPAIIYQNQPVITSTALARFYGTAKTNISSNYTYWKHKFEVGKHLYLVKGRELKELKNECRISASVEQREGEKRTVGDVIGLGKRVNQITLWTERGAARHAKMLDTDQAWEVFEKLEEFYFNRHKSNMPAPMAGANITPEQQREVQKLVSEKVYSESSGSKADFSQVYRALKDRFKVPSYKDIPRDKYDEVSEFLSSFMLKSPIQPVQPMQHVQPVSVSAQLAEGIDPAILALIKKLRPGDIDPLIGVLATMATNHDYSVRFTWGQNSNHTITGSKRG